MADLGGFLSAAGAGNAIGAAVVQLELSTAKYNAELEAAQTKTTASANSMSSGLTKASGLSQTALLAAGTAAVAFGSASVKAAMAAEQAMAQTEAVIKSTGGAAGVTADDVLSLAGSLRDLTGVDDEAIQGSENLLLTFRDVRNELGKGNDIFDQAEKSILDMATALNEGAIPSAQDLHSVTIQLGKALNDPIQGLTALRRVGVSFSESQVETIKRLQESGDLMGAQKIILGELQKEFGGAARAAGDTFAGQMAILNSKIGDLEESVGRLLIPALKELADTATDVLDPISAIVEKINGLTGGSDEAGFSIGGLYHGLVDLANPIEAVIHPIGRFQEAWRDATGAGDALNETLASQRGVIGELSDFYRGKFSDALTQAGKETSHFADMTAKDLAEWSADTKESFQSYVINLGKVDTETDMTKHDLRLSFEAMLRHAHDLNDAMRTISKEHWINDDFVKFLAEQPDKFILFADSNEKAQQRMQAQWEKSGEILKNQVNDRFDELTGILDGLDKGETKHTVKIKYEYEGFDPTKPGMSNNTPSETRRP